SKQDFPKFTSNFENGRYIISSKMSVGVMIINKYKSIRISTNAKITNYDQETIVNLKTRLRPEYLFITFAFIFITIISYLTRFETNVYWITVLFAVVFMWFKIILQHQEKDLHRNIIKYFRGLESKEN